MNRAKRDWLFTAFVALAFIQGLLLLLRRTRAPLPFSDRTFDALRLVALALNVAAFAARATWGRGEGGEGDARGARHDP